MLPIKENKGDINDIQILPGATGKGLHHNSSLLRNLLIIKHHAPQNLMYSKYQIMKILKNCFRSMNCFFWIKLILVLIHLKYWYYNSSYAELPYLPHHICQMLPQPTETLSTQTSSCSSSFSIFSPTPFNHKPPHVLDIPNHI